MVDLAGRAGRVGKRLIHLKEMCVTVEHQHRASETHAEVGERPNEQRVFVESGATGRQRFRIPHVGLQSDDDSLGVR
jgi:hypothetical protein